MNKNYNFILASASPRRKELLSIYTNNFKIMPADIDESFPENMDIDAIPLYIAKKKAETLKNEINDNDIIITADTVVILDNTIYGKPKSKDNAFCMLNKLSNKEHKVVTGVCCYSGDDTVCIEFTDTTFVKFITLDDDIIYNYLSKNEYIDKAGAYAVQGYGSLFIEKINGSYDNVVGLPVGKLMVKLLKYNINIFDI